MSSSVYNLPVLSNYEKTEAFFNRTKVLRGKPDTERPMHPDRGGHYYKFRVVKNKVEGRECFDLVLFETPVIRYFKPNDDGTRQISFRSYPSSITRAFMYRHGWPAWKREMLTTKGETVLWFVPKGNINSLSSMITLDADSKLVVDKSWHALLSKNKSSDEDKQIRKDFKRVMEPVFDMLMVQEGAIKDKELNPIKEHGWLRFMKPVRQAEIEDIKAFVADQLEGHNTHFLNPKTLDAMREQVGMNLYEEARKRAWDKAHNEPHSTYEARNGYVLKETEAFILSANLKDSIIKLRDDLMERLGLMGQTEEVAIPMFPDPASVPKTGLYSYWAGRPTEGELFSRWGMAIRNTD